MVRLIHNASAREILRTPPEDFDYLAKPEIWGMPVLMPPNRIRDGVFVYQGRTYQLPVNEPMPRNNTLHGIILHKPWSLEQTADNRVELAIDYPGAAANEGWEHEFSARLSYTFGENDVTQTITFTNRSALTMPLMVGFHSAFALPDGCSFYLDAERESRQQKKSTSIPSPALEGQKPQRAKGKEDFKNYKYKVSKEEKETKIEKSEIGKATQFPFKLAYAITVHKSQGCEYPIVIIPLYNAPPMLLTRNLFYTAVTRAQKMVVLVGRTDIAEKMVLQNRTGERYTCLKQRLIT